jgi:hypothetical protein
VIDCQRRKCIEVLGPVAKWILNSTLICVMVLLLGCSDKTPSSKTYERAYFVDWGHGFQEGLGEVEIKGKWGFINSSGQIVIKPKFNQVFRGFTEGIALVRRGAIIEPKTRDTGELGRLVGKCAFIDRQGRTIWEYPASAQPFSEGLAAVCIGGRWGILSEAFGAEAKWGFINTKGEFVIPAKYMRVGSFSEGLAAFKVASWNGGYINAKGEVVIEPNYALVSGFSEGLAAVCKEEGWGFINKQGEVVIPLKYESARSFHEGLAAVSIKDKKNEKWGFINKNGDVIIPLQYDYAVGFRKQLAAVKKNDKWGYINASGDLVIPFRFDDAEAFSDGLAQVEVGDKWGYIDKKGEFIIEPKFGLTSPFTEGFAKVAVGDKLGYIDKQGKYIWEPTR